MLLAELAEASGTSTASIKVYRREGLLPPGDRGETADPSDGGVHQLPQHLDQLQPFHVL